MPASPILTAVEIEQLARFDEHWRVCLAGDNRLLAGILAQRGYPLELLEPHIDSRGTLPQQDVSNSEVRGNRDAKLVRNLLSDRSCRHCCVVSPGQKVVP